MVSVRYLCPDCGSADLVWDGNVKWNELEGENVLVDIIDDTCFCMSCYAENRRAVQVKLYRRTDLENLITWIELKHLPMNIACESYEVALEIAKRLGEIKIGTFVGEIIPTVIIKSIPEYDPKEEE